MPSDIETRGLTLDQTSAPAMDGKALTHHGPLTDVVHSVAHNVKRLRTTRGLSQAELARQSGIAKATLSQLEVGRGNPTIETLFALSRVLRVPLGSLLNEIASGATDVSRAAGRPVVEGTAVDMSLTDSFSSGDTLYECYLVHVRHARQEAVAHAAGVQERILVVSGRLLTGPLSDPVVLEPGDYIRFGADRPHVYEGLDGTVTASLLISYPLSGATGSSD